MSRSDSAYRCADEARVRADPLAGTAPPTRRWLLLEHPGPWRIDAVAGAGIDPEVLTTLTRRAGTTTRILLVRRTGRIDREAPRNWILAGLDMDTVTGPWRSDDDLLDAADALTGVSAPPAIGHPEPLILVCTHGVHDVCCALRGRPVAATWRRGGRGLSGNAATLAATGSHQTSSYCPTASITAISIRTARWSPSERTCEASCWPTSCVAWRASCRRFRRQLPPAYRRYGPLGPSDVTVRSTEHVGPHHGHGSETIVELAIEPQQRLLTVRVLSVRRPEAKLTCRAARETPATEYRIIGIKPS